MSAAGSKRPQDGLETASPQNGPKTGSDSRRGGFLAVLRSFRGRFGAVLGEALPDQFSREELQNGPSEGFSAEQGTGGGEGGDALREHCFPLKLCGLVFSCIPSASHISACAPRLTVVSSEPPNPVNVPLQPCMRCAAEEVDTSEWKLPKLWVADKRRLTTVGLPTQHPECWVLGIVHRAARVNQNHEEQERLWLGVLMMCAKGSIRAEALWCPSRITQSTVLRIQRVSKSKRVPALSPKFVATKNAKEIRQTRKKRPSGTGFRGTILTENGLTPRAPCG